MEVGHNGATFAAATSGLPKLAVIHERFQQEIIKKQARVDGTRETGQQRRGYPTGSQHRRGSHTGTGKSGDKALLRDRQSLECSVLGAKPTKVGDGDGEGGGDQRW